MQTNFLNGRFTRGINVYRISGTKHEALLNKLDKLNGISSYAQHRKDTEDTNFQDCFIPTRQEYGRNRTEMSLDTLKNLNNSILTQKNGIISLDMLNKLNCSDSFTRIEDTIIMKDGTTFKINEIPKLNVESLDTLPSAKDNVMDFGSENYFKYTNSDGKSLIIFSRPGGSIGKPWSENLEYWEREYDEEANKYTHFWNVLAGGQAMMSSHTQFQSLGYYEDEIRSYLDEAGISKGFFSVKIGSASSEFFYSSSQHCALYTKEEYDFRYYTMTSYDFSYDKSVFRELEPGTEVTIAGENYAVKEDLTLDIPYGIDLYDIQLPKHNSDKESSDIDYTI